MGLDTSVNETELSTFTSTSKSDGTTGIYKTKDNLGTSYYFRGDVENNYVYFAGFYWRIIRINGDGSIRMIYDGTTIHNNGESSTDKQIGLSAYNINNDDNTYVGYMYGTSGADTYNDTHANINDSTIKTVLDNWYENNIKDTSYEQYVVDAIYCNDRTRVVDIEKSAMWDNLFGVNATGEGYGTKLTYYGFLNRFSNDFSSITPSLKCELDNDKFTTNDNLGNGKLTYPIGLITLDEMVFAGSYLDIGGGSNENTYLYNGSNYYWTMSPIGSGDRSAIIGYDYQGLINFLSSVNDSKIGVRPIITISSSSLKNGTGLIGNPFRIEDELMLLSPEQTLINLGLTESTGTPDFSTVASTPEIYQAEDDFGDSYYFRGGTENNYVYFAGFYWRIIRINGDGAIRMIYDGTTAHENGIFSEDRQISTGQFAKYSDGNTYVGYMYGDNIGSTYAQVHANTSDSRIKETIDAWYKQNIKDTQYEQYIADAIYCNDREVSSGDGIYSKTYYKARERLITNKTPTLKCNQINDRFTVNSEINGVTANGALTYPIGLITADEVAYAGGLYGISNGTVSGSSTYLYINGLYYTMSPLYYGGTTFGIYFALGGQFYNSESFEGVSIGIRPVISIYSTALTSGTGSKTNPFTIS